jgi:hypothetical protein
MIKRVITYTTMDATVRFSFVWREGGEMNGQVESRVTQGQIETKTENCTSEEH